MLLGFLLLVVVVMLLLLLFWIFFLSLKFLFMKKYDFWLDIVHLLCSIPP